MAQLNPNFEIDFNDINSYEQIQLINDTQLAKENLLMHKAYKEPAEDEIIRNQFSSFTFVDFCPKLITTVQQSTGGGTSAKAGGSRAGTPNGGNRSSGGQNGSSSLRANQYELETFSDLFERINAWLKLNKDWRVVSMETLIFDCTSQFNHLKSSIHSSCLPRNMRGLRLYLSPSKSRFSGPQKIGCINVIPRRTRGSYLAAGLADPQPLEYETLDEILARLNELLLTRPIEGRILSVETITLPIVNGYVNTETNYLMDSRLNLLSERVFSHATQPPAAAPTAASHRQQQTGGSGGCQAYAGTQATNERRAQARATTTNGLIDILRVYYEFGPMLCGLVNLIDFLPRFHLHQPSVAPAAPSPGPAQAHLEPAERSATPEVAGRDHQAEQQAVEIDSTESLTRLIGRSLGWFEAERKRFLAQQSSAPSAECSSCSDGDEPDCAEAGRANPVGGVDLKVCNLQIHTKVMLKSQLARVTPESALERVQTRQMFHAPPRDPITCHLCPASTGEGEAAGPPLSSATHEPHEWCAHLHDLNQAYELKFVRLAYVVPVQHPFCGKSQRRNSGPSPGRLSLPSLGAPSGEELAGEGRKSRADDDDDADDGDLLTGRNEHDEGPSSSSDSSSDSSRAGSSEGDQDEDQDDEGDEEDQQQQVDEMLAAHLDAEELAAQVSLEIVCATNRRHRENELAHQAGEDANATAGDQQQQADAGQLIGQLTYRLFAPCQLVNSSSCFSINPVNPSNPLARRGSVDLNGAAGSLSSDNATPSTLLLPPSAGGNLSESTSSINQTAWAGGGGGAGSASAAAGPGSPETGGGPPHFQQQIISFGAFFPALSHDIITMPSNHNHYLLASGGNNPTSSSYRFNTNEFESVEAIRRRMEVYVTTNSMKVLAGETLIVNLSDHLSCLSNAIEQTIVRASFVASRPASTWVSVYVLYAAVDEPHLPSQLLEQQKLRERLDLISEADEEAVAAEQPAEHVGAEDNMVPVFDDDFKVEEPAASQRPPVALAGTLASEGQQTEQVKQVASTLASLNLEDGSIRVELKRADGGSADAPPLYNSAYERTVALPSQPDHHLTNYLEPVDFDLTGFAPSGQELAGGSGGGSGAKANLWLDEHDLIDVQSYQLSESSVRGASKLLRLRLRVNKQREELAARGRAGSKRGGKKAKGRGGRRPGEDSQCSIM